MRLIESDPSLAAICRSVEVHLGGISTLAAVEIPVVLLADFSQLGPPVTARDPTAYNRSEKRIFVNARVSPSFREDAAHLAHEIGHHAHDTGISGVLLGAKGLHPCLISDWLAAQWGFSEEMRRERLADRGPEYCDELSSISTEEDLLLWAAGWEPRYRMAKLLGRNIAPPKLGL
jgi:hypothetical protein